MMKDYYVMFYCQLMFFRNLEIIAERIWIMFKSLSTLTLRWDTMLNITKVESELIQDPGICLYSLKKVWEVYIGK